MTDYIRREAALEAFENADADVYEDYGDGTVDWGFGRKNIQNVINGIPAADAAEVVYGRWILHHTVTGNPYTECSNCCTDFAFKTDKGTFAKLDMRGMSYCPFCSAKMDGGNDNVSD